jgi:8-oxo-dGTP pyrophosphatase MutT (NUDIX family)
MLHLIPAPLHRQLYRIADRLRRRWWRIRKPRRHSVNVLAIEHEGRVLLVRHSYGPPVWALPGGGLGRNEDPVLAAIREVREELGCGIGGIEPLCGSAQDNDGLPDSLQVFLARLTGEPVADNREVVEARFFDPGALPDNTGKVARRAVAAWRERG